MTEETEFLTQVQNIIADLKKRRNELATEVASLDAQISGLDQYWGTATGRIIPAHPPFMIRGTPPTMPRRKTGFRGKKITTILQLLKEALPGGLGFDEIIEGAAARGVELIRPSLRSQLSKAATKGRIENRQGTYFYVSSGKPRDEGGLPFGGAPKQTEAPVEEGASEEST